MDQIFVETAQVFDVVVGWLTSANFYMRVGAITIALVLAYGAALMIRSRVRLFRLEPEPGPLFDLRKVLFDARDLLFPLLSLFFLGIAEQALSSIVEHTWLVSIAQGLMVIFLAQSFVSHFVKSKTVISLVRWIGVPVAILFVLGWLDGVTTYLDGISLEVGNIKLSVYALVRTFFFGVILFWLGRVSNDTGKRVIRNQPNLDIGTREVIVKLFEIGLFVFIFLMLLQIMGINLTALAVFGGALGVGLGFGLQQIASNFISGLIILLDRSITIDDFIELEDGRSGRLRELNMRYATLETYDGKDIMVPNETFITTAFTNWTHNNKKQRYPIEFSVAYGTDLPKLFDIVREVVASHPLVLSGPDVPIAERPDAEISGFGDSGITILVEFWMEAIDDGEYRVGADLLLMIWMALKENGIEIPFPQREVKILNSSN